MNNAIVCLGLVAALMGISLTGAALCHYGGDLLKRWRAARREEGKWRQLLK